jgi:uncharacterized protein
MGERIDTVAGLEAIIGKMPPPMNLKVIDHLDSGAQRWIAASPIMFVTFGARTGIGVSAAGGKPGAIESNERQLLMPKAMVDNLEFATPGAGAGCMFLLPGIREILRVNGTVSEASGTHVVIDVAECYGHCGKALLRSGFWDAEATAPGEKSPNAVAALCRFIALGTMDAHGRADCSPKGDPAGSLVHLEPGALWFADRPGNKRIDSFKNIVTQARVAAALVIPGTYLMARASGEAVMTTDERQRERFSVQDKVPSLVTCIRDLKIDILESPALRDAGIWPVQSVADQIDPTQLFIEHFKMNKGVTAKLMGAAMSIPGLVQKGLEQDYKKNLY